jgi:undecaprenyl diphosphate synthase
LIIISPFLFSTTPIKIEDIKNANIPKHVAIIMDGNGRWAARKNLPRIKGHMAGVKNLRQIVETSVELGVEFLTVFAFSSENWNRPKDEVDFLMQLFVDCINQEVDSLNKNGVKVRIIGNRRNAPAEVIENFESAEEVTKNNNRLVLNIAFNYGARKEIIGAVRSMCADVRERKLDINKIDEKTFSQYLYTGNCPDPDLLIRTSGECRMSNFLLWQSAYTEFYFTKTLWPDFKKKNYLKAIKNYQKRNRRFGRL